jgi:hypothetical protein
MIDDALPADEDLPAWLTSCRDVRFTIRLLGKCDERQLVDVLAWQLGEGKPPSAAVVERFFALTSGLEILASAPIPHAVCWRRGSA